MIDAFTSPSSLTHNPAAVSVPRRFSRPVRTLNGPDLVHPTPYPFPTSPSTSALSDCSGNLFQDGNGQGDRHPTYATQVHTIFISDGFQVCAVYNRQGEILLTMSGLSLRGTTSTVWTPIVLSTSCNWMATVIVPLIEASSILPPLAAWPSIGCISAVVEQLGCAVAVTVLTSLCSYDRGMVV